MMSELPGVISPSLGMCTHPSVRPSIRLVCKLSQAQLTSSGPPMHVTCARPLPIPQHGVWNTIPLVSYITPITQASLPPLPSPPFYLTTPTYISKWRCVNPDCFEHICSCYLCIGSLLPGDMKNSTNSFQVTSCPNVIKMNLARRQTITIHPAA